MKTINQLVKEHKLPKFRKEKRKDLDHCPQKRGICKKLFIMTPRKPNSALRKVARVILSNRKHVNAYIPGMGHTLQKYANVLVRGGNVKDLPGLKYTLIRGKFDFHPLPSKYRKQCRSRYGVKFDENYHELTTKDRRYAKPRYWS